MFQVKTHIADQLLSNFLSKEYIAIIPHASPDGDAIGSAFALKRGIQQFHNHVDVFCIDQFPKNLKYLQCQNEIKQNLDLNTYSILCFVDCGNKQMSKFDKQYPDLYSKPNTLKINIDHHASNDNFGDINYVDHNSSSTCQIIFKLFTYFNWNITPEIANLLQTGIQFDTGGFLHNNTTSEVLNIASKLTKLGANNNQISRNLFKIKSIEQLKLWGRAFERINLNHNQIVSTVLTKNDFKSLNPSNKSTEGIIDYINAIPNKKISILVSEDDTGIKASLRTLDKKYNLNKIANLFGGGGHTLASGFKIKGKITQKNYWEITN
jgi:phosphoesterase RecJ-like protein